MAHGHQGEIAGHGESHSNLGIRAKHKKTPSFLCTPDSTSSNAELTNTPLPRISVATVDLFFSISPEIIHEPKNPSVFTVLQQKTPLCSHAPKLYVAITRDRQQVNKCLQGVTAKKLGEMAGEGTSGISTAPSAPVLGGRQQKEKGEQTDFL